MLRQRFFIVGLLTAILPELLALWPAPTARADDWPQWRGQHRTNVSPETGLLKEWPEAGPPLLWKAAGLGDGVASVAVASGRVFTLGYRGDSEYVTALDGQDGKQVWTTRLGPSVKEASIMRWLSQRTPTVDSELMYAFTTNGELICLETATGQERWRKDYIKDFKGQRGNFGFYCDYPLVDGDRLICTPGVKDAVMVALDKKTGDLVWKAALPVEEAIPNYRPAYAGTVIAEIGGVRQYVNSLGREIVGVAAADGKVLWRHPKLVNGTANTGALIVRDDLIFYANGYGSGCGVFRPVATKNGFQVEEIWTSRKALPSWLGSPVLVGEHVYFQSSPSLVCIEFKSGKVVWEDGRFERAALTYADGRLYLRGNAGKVGLFEILPTGTALKGTFAPPRPSMTEPSGVFPVVSNGRLYLRDMDVLLCYDIKDPRKQGRAPRPIFVPSPQDVVEKMLELAQVTRDDVLCDLGCGDGRIVVTAAKKYGCKAFGYDLDADCVARALENVKSGRVADLVRIEKKDLFAADLREVTVATLYLLPIINEKLVPQLEKMKPGSRIVSHAFDIPGYRPDKVIRFVSEEDELERPIYLWTTPLKKEIR